jgi:hypothetical protein
MDFFHFYPLLQRELCYTYSRPLAAFFVVPEGQKAFSGQGAAALSTGETSLPGADGSEG